MIKNILNIVQICLSLLLILLIFLQTNNGDDSRSNFLTDIQIEKRGWEKITFSATLIILVIFLITSIIQTFY